jgi:zinc transport system ATP-binding protein
MPESDRTASAESPVLDISSVTIRRDERSVLSDLNLEIPPATIHLLVGPNGAGKSTLFGAILGLVEFSGNIRFHWRGQGRLGYVPQRFAVDRTLPLTVEEFLALSRQRRPICLGVSRERRQKTDELLNRVGLRGFGRRALGALSGGELQRVLLANAIDPAPELLLLDEPASGLDQASAAQFEEVLQALKSSGGTSVLMVSHDLSQARRLADHVTLVAQGVCRTGTPAALLPDGAATPQAPGFEPWASVAGGTSR